MISSTNRQEYAFTDQRKNKHGKVYYRLKQIDLDGKSKIYGLKALHFETIDRLTVEAYPNPIDRHFTLLFKLLSVGRATIALHDVTGKILFRKEQVLETGASTLEVNSLERLGPGVCLLRVELSDQVQTIRLVKN